MLFSTNFTVVSLVLKQPFIADDTTPQVSQRRYRERSPFTGGLKRTSSDKKKVSMSSGSSNSSDLLESLKKDSTEHFKLEDLLHFSA